MLSSYVGIMGSGKSVLAVNRIYNNFSTDTEAKKEKNVTFKNCYTNIEGFKFDKVKNTKLLDFDVLLKILNRLHTLYKLKKGDAYLVRFCELLKIKDTFFVIDEAQNYFDVENKILVWWITYHRHLYHEILMITPDLGLIHLKYKKLNELVYVAKPRLLVLDKRFFVYNIYCNYKLTRASHTGKIKFKSNPKVFELYKSGDSINGENIVLKFVLIALAILTVLFLFVNFFILDKAVPEALQLETKSETIPQGEISQSSPISETHDTKDYQNLIFFTLACGNKKCSNDDISIPPLLLKSFFISKSVTLIHFEKRNNNLHDYYLETTKDFYDYLKPKQKEKNKDEKNSNSGGLTDGLFSSTPTSK